MLTDLSLTPVQRTTLQSRIKARMAVTDTGYETWAS